MAIVGPSGCGKSTILSLISGIFEPEEGEVRFKTLNRPMIGYMLQRDHLFPWRTIWSNCMLGLEVQNEKTPEKMEYAEYLLKEYSLDDINKAIQGIHFPENFEEYNKAKKRLVFELVEESKNSFFSSL